MPKTIAEKILSRHAQKNLQAGDFAVCKVDFAFGQDGTSPIIIDQLQSLRVKKLKTKFCLVIDHNSPSPTEGTSLVHQKMRQAADRLSCRIFDIGCGICHQVIPESGMILPGDLVLGAASSPGDVEYKWVKVISIDENGTVVNEDTGLGPIVLNDKIPTNSVLAEIIPVLDTSITDPVKTQIIDQAFAYKTFGLRYDFENSEWRVIIANNLDTSNDFSIKEVSIRPVQGTGIMKILGL